MATCLRETERDEGGECAHENAEKSKDARATHAAGGGPTKAPSAPLVRSLGSTQIDTPAAGF